MAKSNKKWFLFLIPVIVGLALFLWEKIPEMKKNSGGDGMERPNLVIIVSDALRRDVLGCYGGAAHTPNIDRLAREGTVFDNAYSTAPSTMPSSVAMLTGNYARTYAFDSRKVFKKKLKRAKTSHFFRVGRGARLLAEALGDAGYDAGAMVENGLVRGCNLLQGYQMVSPLENLTRKSVERIQSELGFHARNESYGKLAGMLDFLLSTDHKRPFVAFTWIYDPHGPYCPPEKFKTRIQIPPDLLPRPESYYTSAKQRLLREAVQAERLTSKEVGYLRGLYLAEVESVDERVGYIIKALEQKGQLDKSLILFTSDHGESLGEHRHFGHARAIFQELVRVPLIFRGPGIPSGHRVSAVLSHLDLTPTLKDLMRMDAPRDTQGSSYASLFRGGKISRRFLYFDWFSNFLSNWIGVDGAMDPPFKLIVKRDKGKFDFTLFDLSKDPGEEMNLAEESANVAKRLFARIQNLRKKNMELLKRHVGQLGRGVDPDQVIRRTREKLKSLGYL